MNKMNYQKKVKAISKKELTKDFINKLIFLIEQSFLQECFIFV